MPDRRLSGLTRPRECVICELAAIPTSSPRVGRAPLVAYADDDVVAFLPGDDGGVLVAPHDHVPRLSTTPARAAVLLSALRRAVTMVQTASGVSGAAIELANGVCGAEGHICYRIVPTLSQTAGQTRSSPRVDPERLAAALATA